MMLLLFTVVNINNITVESVRIIKRCVNTCGEHKQASTNTTVHCSTCVCEYNRHIMCILIIIRLYIFQFFSGIQPKCDNALSCSFQGQI